MKKRNKPPPLTDTQKIIVLYGVARGMATLHSLHILHRDLKPANILLDSRGYPRIADLGLAKVTETAAQSQRCGTLLYLAPEVYNDDPETECRYSFPADVFSYAMVFYEILEGKYPMSSQNIAAASKSRPKFSKITNENHKQLLRNTWAHLPEKRLRFPEIAKLLEQEEFWLPGTNREEFLAYKAWLDGEEAALAGSRASFSAGLASLVRKDEIDDASFASILAMSHLGDLAAQVTEAVLFMHGVSGAANLFVGAKLLTDATHLRWVKVWLEGLAEGSPLERGISAELNGAHEEALEFYKQGALAGDREATLRYAGMLLAGGAEKQGIEILEILAEGGDLNANYSLGDWYYRWKNDHGKALEYFSKCARQTENTRFAHAALIAGEILAELGKVPEARKMLASVTARGDGHPLYARADKKLKALKKG
jgi:TPR repeat protein